MGTHIKALQIALVTATVCACTPTESPYKGSNQLRVIPEGNSLSVVNAKTESEARPWALEYCSKQGRSPRFKGMGMRYRSSTAEYDCVAGAQE